MDDQTRTQVQVVLSRFSAVGAAVLIGALPLFLLGRFDGFPNILLSSVVMWGLTWAAVANLRVSADELPGWRWILLGTLFAAKAGVTIFALFVSLRSGHITWRFPVALVAVWLAVAAMLLFGLPVWNHERLWEVLTLVLMIPLARPALCPLAVAANRNR